MSIIFTLLLSNVNISDMEFGESIKAARRKRGISQKQLAAKAGISRPSLIAYETGRTPPSIDIVSKIAVALEESAALDEELVVDGDYVIRRLVSARRTTPAEQQLCLEFDQEVVFADATVRIKPTRETIMITAILPNRSRLA